MTPTALARELGVSASTVRRWLRERVVRLEPGRPWVIDDESAADAREYFESTRPVREWRHGSCTVGACGRVAVARGMCRMHYNRWHRTGSTDGLPGGAHQQHQARPDGAQLAQRPLAGRFPEEHLAAAERLLEQLGQGNGGRHVGDERAPALGGFQLT